MALAVEQHFNGELSGIAITRYGHGLPTKQHPRGRGRASGAGRGRRSRGAGNPRQHARNLKEDDLLLALLSGGGSSLLAFPIEGLSMAELKSLTGQLLRSGGDIQEINTVRKHLSAIQGGRLAAACRAPVLALIISDVTGDDPTHIASGPCAPDPTTIADAKAVLAKYGIDFRGPFSESPKSGPGNEQGHRHCLSIASRRPPRFSAGAASSP